MSTVGLSTKKLPRKSAAPLKLYYRIGEVAELLGVETHVLRYWETEFRSVRPQKSPTGQRVYSRKDLEKLQQIKELVHQQGFTLAGAKKKLQQKGEEPGGAPEVRGQQNQALRAALLGLREELTAELRRWEGRENPVSKAAQEARFSPSVQLSPHLPAKGKAPTHHGSPSSRQGEADALRAAAAWNRLPASEELWPLEASSSESAWSGALEAGSDIGWAKSEAVELPKAEVDPWGDDWNLGFEDEVATADSPSRASGAPAVGPLEAFGSPKPKS